MSDDRELSLYQAAEFVRSLQKKGLDSEMAQKVIESVDNRLAGKLISLIKDHNIPSIPGVRHILGTKYLFGPEEWLEYFHLKIDKAPEIPWTENEIKASKMRQFLFLGIEYINGEATSPMYFRNRFPEMKIDLCSFEWRDFMQRGCELRWYLMPVGIFPGSTNKYLEDQVKLLRPTQWWIPTVAERFTANVLFYLLNKKYLDNDIWANTKTNFGANEYVLIRSSKNELCLGTEFSNNTKESIIGVAASMKLPN